MAWKRREAPDYGGACSNVPSFESWPELGIAGTITRGYHAGEPVLALRVDSRRRLYTLWIPVDELMDAEGSLVMESDVVGEFRTDGSGGLIDLLTRELSVSWSTDATEALRVRDWYWSR